MRFFVTYDADIESGLDDVLDPLVDLGFKKYFAEKYYEDSGIEMAVVLMCRDPRWNFKQRIRFVKKDNCLYMDIMLDLPILARADASTRKRIVAQKMTDEIPQIVAKYKFKDFDLERFSSDLRNWFEDHGWIDQESEWPLRLN